MTTLAGRQSIMERQGLVGHLQLVQFHPNAVHSVYAETSVPDAADFSIRSPLPTFHFLREVAELIFSAP